MLILLKEHCIQTLYKKKIKTKTKKPQTCEHSQAQQA